MRAFVLAGGLGTRLKPRFGDLPKPLAPIGGKPFLARQLEWLGGHGVRDAVLCVGYGADQVRASLGERVGDVTVRYSVENEPLGTGGALQLAARYVDGPTLVANGDTLADIDPWALERARWEHGALGAIALFRVPDASQRGRVECRDDGSIARFVEKDTVHIGPAWVNGGLYVFGPGLWRRLPPAGPSSLERDVLPALAEEHRLAGYEADGEFFDIGTPDEWERAERRFAT